MWTVSLSFFNYKLEQKGQSHQMDGFWKTQISSYLWRTFVTTVLSIKASIAPLRYAVGWSWGSASDLTYCLGMCESEMLRHLPQAVGLGPTIIVVQQHGNNKWLIFFLAPKYELAQIHFFAHVSCSCEHLLKLLSWWDVSEQSMLELFKTANFFFPVSPFSPH